MMREVSIRPMGAADLDQVACIEKDSIRPPWSREGFAEALKQDTLMIVAEDGEKNICGYVVMYISFDEGEITNVAVAPAYRGQKISSALMEAAGHMAAERGVTRIVLEVRAHNTPAIGLYRKTGFAELGIRKNFYEDPVEDARIMEWILC